MRESRSPNAFEPTDPGVFVLVPGSRLLHLASPFLSGRTHCEHRWNDAIRPQHVPPGAICKKCPARLKAVTHQIATAPP